MIFLSWDRQGIIATLHPEATTDINMFWIFDIDIWNDCKIAFNAKMFFFNTRMVFMNCLNTRMALTL